MLVITHPACLGHDPGPDHPETPARLRVVLDALQEHLGDRLQWQQARPAKFGELASVHERSLIDLLFVLARVLARAAGQGEVLWQHARRHG